MIVYVSFLAGIGVKRHDVLVLMPRHVMTRLHVMTRHGLSVIHHSPNREVFC
jgi:hypothetical protein